MSLVALILAAFFAMNMGGSGMSPAFAAPYGAGVISRKKAAFLFGIVSRQQKWHRLRDLVETLNAKHYPCAVGLNGSTGSPSNFIYSSDPNVRVATEVARGVSYCGFGIAARWFDGLCSR